MREDKALINYFKPFGPLGQLPENFSLSAPKKQ